MPCKSNIQTIVVDGFFTVTGGTAPTVVTSGPETVNPGDNLHIWSAGGLDINVTPGSARANIEPANITSNFATPGAPAAPADPTRSAAHLAADGVYMWDVANAVWRLAGNTAASGAFVGLTDTPASYVGAGGQGVRVNAGETGLEFFNVPDTWLALGDTPATYAGQAGFVPIVNAGETALIYADPATFDTSIYQNDGALTANRTVTGSGFNMNFAGVNDFNVSGVNFSHILTGTAAITSVGDLNFVSTGGVSTLGSNTRVDLAGEVRAVNYLETRDDSAVDPPINFLYTEAVGDLRSAPITALNIPATTLDLTDTPAAYGAVGDYLAVDATGTALEWVTPAGAGVTAFTALTDTPAAYTGAGLQGLRVNAGETGVEFYNVADTWLELADTPAFYTGQAGFIPQVNALETGLQFVDPATLDTTIYSTDGTLTANRALDGGGFTLGMTNLDSFTTSATNNVTLTSTAGDVLVTAANLFQVAGESLFSSYPSTRDDTGTFAPVNFLYTGAGGELYSAPITALPAPPADGNIYDNDGNLAGDRTVIGFGQDLTFLGMDTVTIAPVDFTVNTTGNVQFTAFPNTRDDSATLRPANTLYTDANGNLLAVPGTVISEVAAPPIAPSPFDAAVAFDTGTIPGVPIPYFWDGAAWLPFPAGDNIYTADGALTADRTLIGAGNDLSFTGVQDFNLTANNRFDLAGQFASIVLAAGDIDWNFDGPAGTVDMDAAASQDLLIGGTSRLFVEAGSLIFGDYPDTRDDGSGANYLFTDASGVLQSGAIANLGIPDDILDLTDTPATYGAVGDYLAVDATGTALEWVTPAGAGVNLYNSDGQLTANRVVDGDGNSLTFDNASNVTIQNTGTFAAPVNTVQLGVNGGSVQISGEIDLFDYPGSRDDTGLTQVENILYTDAFTGYLQSAPISTLISQTTGAPATSPNIANSIAYDAASGDIYGWDGAAWQTLGGGGPATNIYTSDGVLTGNRVVTGGANDLDFTDMGIFRVGQGATVDDIFLQGGDAFGAGAGGSLQLSFTAATVLRSNNTNITLQANGGDYNFDTNNVQFVPYPATRDDTGTFAPQNFLYTSAGGDVFSAPLTALPSTNIYNSDGVLTGNRIVDGNGFDLEFDNSDVFAARADSIALFSGGDTSGPGIGGLLNFSVATGVVLLANNADIRLQTNGVTHTFRDTNVQFPPYPRTRDDSAISPPQNFLYTDLSGRVLSSPISSIPIPPPPPDTTIYDRNGTLTADRTLDGNGLDLTFTNIGEFVTQTNAFTRIESGPTTVEVNNSNVVLTTSGTGSIELDSPFIEFVQFPNTRDDTFGFAILPDNQYWAEGATGVLNVGPWGAGQLTAANTPINGNNNIWNWQDLQFQIQAGANLIQFTAGAPASTAFSLNATPGLAEMSGEDMQLTAIDGAGTGQMNINGDEVTIQASGTNHVAFPNTPQGSDDTVGTPLQTLTYAGPAGEHLAASATQLLAYGAGAPVTPPNVAANVASLFVDTTGPNLYFWDGGAWVLII